MDEYGLVKASTSVNYWKQSIKSPFARRSMSLSSLGASVDDLNRSHRRNVVDSGQSEEKTTRQNRMLRTSARLNAKGNKDDVVKTESKKAKPKKSVAVDIVKIETSESEDDNEVSAYERKRLENIERNKKLMATIGLTSAASDIKKEEKERIKARNAAKKRRQEELENLPRRQSRRVQGQKAEFEIYHDLNDWIHEKRGTNDQEDDQDDGTDEEAESWANADGAQLLGDFCDGLGKKSQVAAQHSDAPYSLDKRDVQKVIANRVYSMAVHSNSSIMTAIADTEGYVALWTTPVDHKKSSNQENGLVPLKPHKQAVSTLLFQDTSLLSSSFDGRLLQYDLTKNTSTEVLNCDVSITNFQIKSQDEMLVSGDDGSLFVVDRRDSKSKKHSLHEKKINTVHIHPNATSAFVTASLDRTVKLWDSRHLKNAVASLPHEKSVNCASFSPDGAHLVTVCQDNFVYLYDINPSSGGLARENPKKIKHDNYSGRWLTKFHAAWDPKKTHDCEFVLGGNKRPRCIEIFGTTSPKPRQALLSDHFNSVHSINIFHPVLNVIVGGNSSGRVALWRQN
ncbi:unnamed protein product [Aphanomyces euteiches]